MQPQANSLQVLGMTELTVLAPIKPGSVAAEETCSYTTRLGLLLAALNKGLTRPRETDSGPSLSNVVARIQGIHAFRLAILPPPQNQLLLVVVFDRAWEPYIRLVWRDLGPLLDVIFCHCTTYPIARDCSFENYVAWIRAHQVQGHFFYAAAGLSVGDIEYLVRVERRQREDADPIAADRAIAELTIPDPDVEVRRLALDRPAEAALGGLDILSRLYRLTDLFPPTLDATNRDHIHLLRAVRELLPMLLLPRVAREFAKGTALRAQYKNEIAWFEQTPAPVWQPPADTLTFAPGDIQGGILTAYGEVTHGCLVLVSVASAAQGRAFIATLDVDTESQSTDASRLHCNLAITLAGLTRLGVAEADIQRFPREFVQGMEERAGALGDVRTNHGTQWKNLPQRLVDAAQGVGVAGDVLLSEVHLVVQLRIKGRIAPGDDLWHLQHPLFNPVAAMARQVGVTVLAVQPMLRFAGGDGTQAVGHFGFVDGLSQPVVAARTPGLTWDDAVRRGEILLGYGNDRGNDPSALAANPLLANGSFLVVRKLRQNVARLDKTVDLEVARLNTAHGTHLTADGLKALMMGRKMNGAALVASPAGRPNDFNYRADATGARCPLQAHARRSNPRLPDPHAQGPLTQQRPMPRLMRRGMSYGPAVTDDNKHADRGLIFMAYNASLAEQFEVVQRWISGGNATGVSSSQADPFLGVPRTGEPRIFRFQRAGQVLRMNLDSPDPLDPPGKAPDPVVKLEWGMYLFVPSMAAIGMLSRPLPISPISALARRGQAILCEITAIQGRLQGDRVAAGALWKSAFEDLAYRRADAGSAIWAAVRELHGGVLDTQSEFGVLVGHPDLVMQVFGDNANYTVSGYMERMQASIGPIYLGLDDGPEYQQQASAINAAIQAIRRDDAFSASLTVTRKILASMVHPPVPASVDIRLLADGALAGLCRLWFDLPDDVFVSDHPRTWNSPLPTAGKPRCPAHFISPSRYLFSTLPGGTLTQSQGQRHGQEATRAVLAFVKRQRSQLHTLRGELSKAMFAALPDNDAQLASAIVGVMMGFLPTVDGNLRRALYQWVEDGSLWIIQRGLTTPLTPDAAGLRAAQAALLPALLRIMQAGPVPETVWRRAKAAHQLGHVPVAKGARIVIGIQSATQARQGAGSDDVFAVFGGDRSRQPHPTHACPAFEMAMGVMLGFVAALLERTISRQSSNQVLRVT